MAIFSHNTAFQRVTAQAAQRPVHAAFTWLHNHPGEVMAWQTELVQIPAPPFGEQARSAWLAEWFHSAGLKDVQTDAVGNVMAWLPAAGLPEESTGPLVVLSAHLDTVFPAETELKVMVKGDLLECPGVCDNVAGVVGMLALVRAIQKGAIPLPAPLLLLGNVGEEGEGDLRGVRHFYADQARAGRIAAHIVLDGAGADSAVTEALGSRRFRVEITGPGGHSFTDAGTVNPIAAMAEALAEVAQTPLPAEPRTTLNLGTIEGGTSVNSIPESVAAAVDFRSTSTDELARLELALHHAVEDATEHWNSEARRGGTAERGLLRYQIAKIGDRPAGRLAADSTLLDTLRAVDRHLGLKTDPRLGSTDANIPLALGIEALSMGAGGEGGGAHTLAEWYSARDRETGLKRVLLLTLAMLEWAATQ
jgi:acetylornithine deacetylase/succinyl-diaminopimelate desuccinylase-like protein